MLIRLKKKKKKNEIRFIALFLRSLNEGLYIAQNSESE